MCIHKKKHGHSPPQNWIQQHFTGLRQIPAFLTLRDSTCVAVCCSVLQCVAVCGSVLQYVAVCDSVLQFVVMWCSVFMTLRDSRSRIHGVKVYIYIHIEEKSREIPRPRRVGAHTTKHTATHTATHCNTLQHTARENVERHLVLVRWAHHNILQHTVTHCNILQHTVTHCNIL